MKRIISVFFVAVMCLGMMTTFASAGDSDYDNVVFDPMEVTWYWPLLSQTKIVTSKFAEDRTNGKNTDFHQGIDIGGTNINGVANVYAAFDGVVIKAKKGDTFGNYVTIFHGRDHNGKMIISTYMHMYDGSLKVSEGQIVKGGETILGKVGNTGKSGGPHLHFHVSKSTSKEIPNPAHATYDTVIKNFYNTNTDSMRYTYDAHTHNYKDDVANEKCNCGATMVRQYENAHGQYTVVKNTSIKSKPYASYGERQVRLKVGDKVTVKRKFKNVYGNTWCEVSFGKYSGYAYLGDLKKVEAQNVESTLNINVTQYPTTIDQGKLFGLRGEVTSNYTISSVKGYIINSNGDTVQSTTDTPKSKRMDIRPASLNQNLLFNKLSSGKYTLKIVAKDSSGKSKTWDEVFVVKGEETTAEPSSPAPAYTPALPSYTEPVVAPLATTHKEEKPAVVHSSISIILDTFPKGNLPYGKPFTLSGKFTSDCAIVEARAYMLDENKNVVMEAKGSSTTSNYYIKGYALDNGMKFNKLSPGGYYLKYYVKDANGDTATWVSDKFYIVK
ncbi:MAG: peptidoglycan DD-metalloendopeptidase family protein [Oscillospiraceae bacterium]|nr:peptidoglycan DD-metalloendopeptidase family protein [Oscillospiraceae bacterium]